MAGTALFARFQLDEGVTLRAGAYHADPDTLDETKHNEHGFRFGWDPSETVYIAEAEVLSNFPGELSGVGKIGLWYDTNDYADFDGGGDHDESYGGYLAVDQSIWREEGTEDQGVRALLQYGMAPRDRQAIDLDFSIGLIGVGLIDGLDEDSAGILYMHPRLGDDFRDTGPGIETESALELTYRAEIRAGLAVQGSLQYIDNPGGASATDFDDAIVFGLRAELSF